MAIEYDASTGWSNLISYDISSNDPYNDNSYRSLNATWFQRSWWENRRWARKFVNINQVAVKLTAMDFLACPGHSNGQTYGGSPSGGLVGPAYGYGCTFTVDLYIDSYGEHNSVTAATTHTLDPINEYNCYYGGYGNVSKTDNQTSFGSVTFYGPRTGRDLDSNGHKKYRHTQEFTFDNAPSIEPGGSMFVHVRPTSWGQGSTLYNSLLVIQSADPFFHGELEPVDQPYIWRFDGTQWVKDRTAFKFDGTSWIELKGDNI